MTARPCIARLLVPIVLVAGLVACSSTSTGNGTSGTSGSSGASGTTPSGNAMSRCVGTPVEASKAADDETCGLQRGEWDNISLTCSGTDSFVSCARADESFSSDPDAARKPACLDIIGCSWTEPDGTITKPSGHCSGTKVECLTLTTNAACTKQPGCLFGGSSCSKFASNQYLNNVDCSGMNFSPTLSVSVARSQCKRTAGCTWTE